MSEMQSFGRDAGPQSCCYSFTTWSIIHCPKSVQKFAVWVCQVATVVMETTQLVLSQFKNFLTCQLRTSKVSLYRK